MTERKSLETEAERLIQRLADELATMKMPTPAGEYSLLEMFARQLEDLRLTVINHEELAYAIRAYGQPPAALITPEGEMTFPDGGSIEMPSATVLSDGWQAQSLQAAFAKSSSGAAFTVEDQRALTTSGVVGTTIFCSYSGCLNYFKSKSRQPATVQREAKAADWEATDDLGFCRCPLHPDNPEGGDRAPIPVKPPEGAPGMKRELACTS